MVNSRPKSPPTPPPPEVVKYMIEELSPLKKEIFPLWQQLLALKVSLWEAIRRKKLEIYEKKYTDCAVRWVNAREKVTVLDKLISPDDPKGEEKLGVLVLGGYLREMEKHEMELTRIMKDFSDTLRDKKAEADYKRVLFISTVAVCIAAISIIVSVCTSQS